MKAAGGVICSGNIVYDTLVYPVEEPVWGASIHVETIESHIGGNGANTSMVLAKLGVPVRLLAAIGGDDQGRFVLDMLRRAGVDTGTISTVDAPTPATVALVHPSGARKFLHRVGASSRAFADPIVFDGPLTDGMLHYHLASIFALPNLRRHAAATLARAREAGLTTSLDTNWDATGRWMQDLQPCLSHLDILFINEDEARMATGSSDPAAAATILRALGVRTAVMKLGGRGCAIYSDATELHCPAFEVEVKDTTGAGDCFVGGFLASLMENRDFGAAGHFGNAVAAMTVQRLGGAGNVPDAATIRTWMHSASVRV